MSRHIADFWQNSPGSRKFTHFLAPGQAVLVGLGMAFPSVKKNGFFPSSFFSLPPPLPLSSAGQEMESSRVLGQDSGKSQI